MHILVQWLEDAAISKDVMEKSSTYADFQTRINLEKIEKLVKVKESAKRNMAELKRAPEDTNRTTKITEKIPVRQQLRATEKQGPPKKKWKHFWEGAAPSTQPTQDPCTYSEYSPDTDPVARSGNRGAQVKTRHCNNCRKTGLFRQACQSGTRVNSTGNKEASLGTLEVLPNLGFFQITNQSHNLHNYHHRVQNPE